MVLKSDKGVIKMSKVTEAYLDELYPDKMSDGTALYDDYTRMSELTEKEKCLYDGIPCTFGTCDECNNK